MVFLGFTLVYLVVPDGFCVRCCRGDETQKFEPLKPKVDLSKKVTRYRAGQVPHFAAGYEEERGFVTASSQVRGVAREDGSKRSGGRKRVTASVVLTKASTATRRPDRQLSDSDERAQSSSGEDVANALQDSSSEEDDEAVDRRRRQLRAKMQQREEASSPSPPRRSERRPVVAQVVKKSESKPEAVQAPPARARAESSSESSSSSEWETDTDDSDGGEHLMKPVFVPKKARETIKRQEEQEAEEERRRLEEEEKVSSVWSVV